LKTTVIRPDELGASDVTTWRTFQRGNSALAAPFLSPEFTIAVGRHRPRSRVAVLSDGNQTVGFFPFEQGRLGCSTPIGAGIADGHGLVHAPGLDWDAAELLRSCGLAVWQFDHLVDGQQPFERYQRVRAASPIMDLRDGFDAYLGGLSHSRSRRNLLRQERRLIRQQGDTQVIFDSHDRHLLHTMMRWKSAQFLRTGLYDLFARPWIVGLLEQLLEPTTDGAGGTISALQVGDDVIAINYVLRDHGVASGWFMAYDPRYAAYSPGLILLLRTAEKAAAAGIDRVDMGKGDTEYKHFLKSRDLFVGEGMVVRRSPMAALHSVRLGSRARLRSFVKGNPVLSRVGNAVYKQSGHIDAAIRRTRSRRQRV
jgi:CelD/BcsL family acetyltransferase involved in cellulose biosynthesis